MHTHTLPLEEAERALRILAREEPGEAAEGRARITLHYKKENSTAGDALHGGAIASLIDTTGAMAAWTTAEIATPKYFGSTVGVNANYLSAVIGEDAFAEGRVL